MAVVAVVAGCSSVRLGYNNADALLYYQLDRYVDLSGAQTQFVRERGRALLAWHRATQLQGYVDLLESVARRVDGHVVAADVLALNLEINRRLSAIGERAAPDIAALVLSLEPTQVDRLARTLAEDDAKARQEASATKRRGFEHRVKRSVERAEEWFGSVSPRQRELIRATLAERSDGEDAWLRERELRRGELLTLAHRIQVERPQIDTATQWVREYLAALVEPRETERRARMNAYRHANAEMIAGLLNAATGEQRATLLRKLRGYADDFVALASTRPDRSS